MHIQVRTQSILRLVFHALNLQKWFPLKLFSYNSILSRVQQTISLPFIEFPFRCVFNKTQTAGLTQNMHSVTEKACFKTS